MKAVPLISALIILAAAFGHAQQPARLALPPGPGLVPDGVKALRDLAYVAQGHVRQKLDLYLPEKAAAAPLPVIVWVHGGGWQSGSKDQCLPLRSGYVERGYAVASVGYRLSSDAVFPAQIEDCKAAIRWLRAHAAEYGLDSQRFAAWGSSAGGHLVSLLGTSGGVKEFETGTNLDQSSRVQAVCDFYGPTDFAAFVTTPGYESHAKADSPEGKLIGGAAPENKEKAARVSSTTYVTNDDPPFLIVHGDKDPVVPPNQSQLLFAALKKAGVSAHFHTIHGAGHGGPGFSGKDIDTMVTAFFDERLKNKSGKVDALETESTADVPAQGRGAAQSGGPAGGARTRPPWDAIVQRDDKNQDGKISREEFSGPPALFDRLDRDRDGFITREEHEAAPPRNPPAPPNAPDPAKPAMPSNTPPALTAEPSAAVAPNIRDFQLSGEKWTCVADGQPLSGILVRPSGPGPFPAILINHGMGSTAAQFGLSKAREFVKWGFVCIATDLTHARPDPNADRSQFGASAENLRRARACLAIVRAQPGVDPKRVCAYGNSMGAFLTIGLAADMPGDLAAAAITAGGVITQPGFAAPAADTAAKIRTPFIILHGSADTTVPPENSARLKQALDAGHVRNERQVFDGVGHNLHAEKADEVYRLISKWFTEQGVLR